MIIDVNVAEEDAYVPTAADEYTSLKNGKEVAVIAMDPCCFH